MQPITDLVTQLKAKSNQQDVAQTEPVFEYMLDALGYHVMDNDFSEAIEEGNDPSPATLSALKIAITSHKIAFIVNNKQTTSATVNNIIDLAKANHIPVVNVTETIPKWQNTVVGWKLAELKQIEAIMK